MGASIMIRMVQIKFWERLALNAFALSKFAKAQGAFEKVLALDPDRRGVRFNLGLTLLSSKRYAEAARHFQEEKFRHGDSLPLNQALGEAAYRMGNRVGAREHYRRAVDSSPSPKGKAFCARRALICGDEKSFSQAEKAQSLLDQADEMMLQGNFDGAEALFEEACRLDETSFQAMNNIGAIRLAKKDYAGARDYFLKADTLVDLPMVKKNLEYLAKQSSR